jgi:hypothetical protein
MLTLVRTTSYLCMSQQVLEEMEKPALSVRCTELLLLLSVCEDHLSYVALILGVCLVVCVPCTSFIIVISLLHDTGSVLFYIKYFYLYSLYVLSFRHVIKGACSSRARPPGFGLIIVTH